MIDFGYRFQKAHGLRFKRSIAGTFHEGARQAKFIHNLAARPFGVYGPNRKGFKP